MRWIGALVGLALCVGCAGEGQVRMVERSVLVGKATPGAIMKVSGWRSAMDAVEVSADPGPVRDKLKEVELTVVLGTWCPDSVREVTAFWGWAGGADVPGVRYIAVDRRKEAFELKEPVVAVPTFIVRRDGEEVGRVVEQAVNGIGPDLLSLIEGSASGTISATR